MSTGPGFRTDDRVHSHAAKAAEYIAVDSFWSVRFLKEHVNRYAFASQFAKNKVVLDVACGIGYGTFLLKRSAQRVVGGEIRPEALSSAVLFFKDSGIDYVRLDAQRLPFSDNSFDVICSFETIEHLPNYGGFLVECLRCLRSGGILLCSTPNKTVSSPASTRTSSGFHIHEFYPDELCDLVGEYFSVLELYGQDPGRTRRGTAVARLAGAVKPYVMRVPGARRFVNAVARLTSWKDYALARLSEIGVEDLIDDRFVPMPVPQDSPTPCIIVVASKA